VAAFLSLLAFVVLLLFAIFFHEFGHFITARWAGIKASKFFIGFGPTVWSTRRGRIETFVGPNGVVEERPETEFGVKAFPIGGFVKIVGMSPAEEVSPQDEPRSFNAAPRWKRAIVLAAGSTSHFITAFVVLFLILTLSGVPDANHPTMTIDSVASTIGNKTSPAAAAGLEAGDRVVAIDSRTVTKWTQVQDLISHSNGTISITVDRDGVRHQFALTPIVDKSSGKATRVIGVFVRLPNKRVNPITAIGNSGRAMGVLVGEFFHRVPTAFSPHTLGLTGGKGPTSDRPFSIIGAGRLATDLASHGHIADFLFLFVEINIFVAIFNLLPLPPLDGGHLIVLLLEKIRGKPIDQRALIPVMAVVLSVLLLLALLLGYYDITSPIHMPGP
jgi:membrane-associated protease RseP (regulator of RpoE activity)